jgi:hypothetical protein
MSRHDTCPWGDSMAAVALSAEAERQEWTKYDVYGVGLVLVRILFQVLPRPLGRFAILPAINDSVSLSLSLSLSPPPFSPSLSASNASISPTCPSKRVSRAAAVARRGLGRVPPWVRVGAPQPRRVARAHHRQRQHGGRLGLPWPSSHAATRLGFHPGTAGAGPHSGGCRPRRSAVQRGSRRRGGWAR